MKQKLLYKSLNNMVKRNISVLGIECSCDDTSVGIVNDNHEILAESKYNQWLIHKKIGHSGGGIVPNIARLLHYENLIPAVSDCIEKISKKWENIDAIALTVKPGLEPCLWEGIQFTKLLLNKYRLPFIPVHHMEAHALVSKLFDKNIRFPFLTLLISGGHCLVAVCENVEKFLILGNTIDIAPGNFIDKISRKIDNYEIDYIEKNLSGGALIELRAANGDPESYPHMIQQVETYCKHNKNCDFSFSGFFSSMNRLIDRTIKHDNPLCKKTLSNLSATTQHLLLIQFEDRLKRAFLFCKYKNIEINDVVVAGGVASNLYIKQNLEKLCNKFRLNLSIPPIEYCTDNGVMIGWNGLVKYQSKSKDVVFPKDQTNFFYENLKPIGKSEFGQDISSQLKLLNIKI